MKYEREPYQPEWYQSDDTKMYYSVTSGSSVFNEWYEFDQFTEESIADGFTCDDLALKEGATVADLQEIINAESGF